MEELLKRQQMIIFSGDGSSHQNGAAECTIKAAVAMEINMLMHSGIRFPEDTFSDYICTIANGLCCMGLKSDP